MSSYTNPNNDEMNWTANSPYPGSFYQNDYNNQFQNQQLEFQTLEEYVEPSMQYNTTEYPQIYDPTNYIPNKPEEEEDEEPPLLEELEIYPDRIFQKMLAVLNPLRSHSVTDDADYLCQDSDLAGPVCICIALGFCLVLSGKVSSFGYIYVLSIVSSVAMYCLLYLMSNDNHAITLTIVASVLGYCLMPVVGLAMVGMFLSLKGGLGIVLALLGVVWSSLSASRLFVALSGDRAQRPLIAYPCAVVAGVFALLVLF